MSLYNLVNGVNPYAMFVTAILFEKHVQELPRFRDANLHTDEDVTGLMVLTRTGGGNRDHYDNSIFTGHPNHIYNEDAEWDETFAIFVFSIPTEFEKDVEELKKGRVTCISNELKGRLYKLYPEKGNFLQALFAYGDK